MSSVFVLEPLQIVFRHWETFCVNLSNIPAQVCDELPVGECHHLRSRHVQGVHPVGHVNQVSQTVELSLTNISLSNIVP